MRMFPTVGRADECRQCDFSLQLAYFLVGRCVLSIFSSLPLSILSVYIKLSYRKIPIISPGLIFVQKVFFLVGLFSGELIFGGAYYWKEFCVSKWVGLDNKTALNTTITP